MEFKMGGYLPIISEVSISAYLSWGFYNDTTLFGVCCSATWTG